MNPDLQIMTTGYNAHNCGTVYAKHETRIEPEIGPIKDAGPKGKIKVAGGEETKANRKRI